MCGRMSRLFEVEAIKKQKKFMIDKIEREFGPSYNVAPSQQIPVIIHGSNILTTMRWGLIPHWAKEKSIGFKMINARAESVTEKPSFRGSFAKRRCIIPVSSFMEWDSGKTPFNFKVKDEDIFALAGLWDEWEDKEDKEIIQSCTVITCEANKFMKEYHHRMPVILKNEDYNEWLDPDADLDLIQRLLKPFDSTKIEAYELNKDVNSPKNNSEDVLKPV